MLYAKLESMPRVMLRYVQERWWMGELQIVQLSDSFHVKNSVLAEISLQLVEFGSRRCRSHGRRVQI